MDLIEADDIRKKWQVHTDEQYKKDLHDQITTMLTPRPRHWHNLRGSGAVPCISGARAGCGKDAGALTGS